MNVLFIISTIVMFLYIVAPLLSTVRIKKIDIMSDECPPEVRDKYFKNNPGEQWRIHILDSFKKVFDDYTEISEFVLKSLQNNEITYESKILLYEIVMFLSQLNLVIEKSLKKLKRFSKFKLKRMVRKRGFNETTTKLLGEEILYTQAVMKLLKTAKNKFQDNNFELVTKEEINEAFGYYEVLDA